MVKPATGDEVTGVVHHRAFRGGWGQRAGKDSSRNLGDPAVRKRERDRRLAGIHNRERGTGRESEGPIVAAKRVTTDQKRRSMADLIQDKLSRAAAPLVSEGALLKTR